MNSRISSMNQLGRKFTFIASLDMQLPRVCTIVVHQLNKHGLFKGRHLMITGVQPLYKQAKQGACDAFGSYTHRSPILLLAPCPSIQCLHPKHLLWSSDSSNVYYPHSSPLSPDHAPAMRSATTTGPDTFLTYLFCVREHGQREGCICYTHTGKR